MSIEAVKELRSHIERIEQAYEFMLAYAAQGRRGDEEGTEIRTWLAALDENLAGLTASSADLDGLNPRTDAAFVTLMKEDRDRARAAVQLVLSRRNISSQLIDNLNASLHLRALLTDLFLLDERLSAE